MNTEIFKKNKMFVSSRLFALSVIGIAVVTSAGIPKKQIKKEKKNPNIVFILADDLGYGDLSCNGATKIDTPVIDSLASSGMRFTNAYASSSLCSPSRYSIMTGRYSWRTRLQYAVLTNYAKPLIEPERVTLASLLKRNGYHTACVGKWHLGLNWELNDKAPANADDSVFNSWKDNAQEYIDFTKPVKGGPIERGFDYFFGMAGSNNMQPYVYIENERVLQAPSEDQLPYDLYSNTKKAPNWDIKTVNQVITHKAVDVINNHFANNKKQPLFLYFPTSAIHQPCLPTFTKGKSRAGLRGDMVAELDWSVREIIKALKKNNVYENTLLIFASDNGPKPGDPAIWIDKYKSGDYEDYYQNYFDDYTPEYINPNGNENNKHGWLTYGHSSAGNFFGFKQDPWEGGLRVPLIVHWPGKVKPRTVNNNAVCASDLLATFADLMGDRLHDGEGEDSYSFLSNIFDSKAPQVRKSLTLASGGSGAFIEIKDGWKYIESAKTGRWPESFFPNSPNAFEPRMYNLKNDIYEQKNLYSKMPIKASELIKVIEGVKTHSKSEAK